MFNGALLVGAALTVAAAARGPAPHRSRLRTVGRGVAVVGVIACLVAWAVPLWMTLLGGGLAVLALTAAPSERKPLAVLAGAQLLGLVVPVGGAAPRSAGVTSGATTRRPAMSQSYWRRRRPSSGSWCSTGVALVGWRRRRRWRRAWPSPSGTERREWDSNPRWARPTHALQACRFVRSRIPPGGAVQATRYPRGRIGPSFHAAAGSCATTPREPSQGREAAALSGSSRVPQAAWPSRRAAGRSGSNPTCGARCRFFAELTPQVRGTPRR
jgi:hypothetical protein